MLADDYCIYALPGLGTDWRIFNPLSQMIPLRYLDWLEPELEEPLASYAARLAAPIRGKFVCLLGVSFGGVVAQEIARQREIDRLILISSLKQTEEKPFWINVLRRIPFHHLSRGSWRIKTLPLWSPQFGIHKKEEQRLLQDMFRGFSDSYRMWAIDQLIQWEAQPPEVPFLHIHGTRDRVLPARKLRGFTPVPKGTHFMVYQQPETIHQHIQLWMKTRV